MPGDERGADVAAPPNALSRPGELAIKALGALPQMSILVFDRELRFALGAGDGLLTHGYTRGSVEGRTLREVLPPAAAERLEPHYRAALAGRQSNFVLRGAGPGAHVRGAGRADPGRRGGRGRARGRAGGHRAAPGGGRACRHREPLPRARRAQLGRRHPLRRGRHLPLRLPVERQGLRLGPRADGGAPGPRLPASRRPRAPRAGPRLVARRHVRAGCGVPGPVRGRALALGGDAVLGAAQPGRVAARGPGGGARHLRTQGRRVGPSRRRRAVPHRVRRRADRDGARRAGRRVAAREPRAVRHRRLLARGAPRARRSRTSRTPTTSTPTWGCCGRS